jgi:hypothetical protein
MDFRDRGFDAPLGIGKPNIGEPIPISTGYGILDQNRSLLFLCLRKLLMCLGTRDQNGNNRKGRDYAY